jgi:formate transporter
MTPTVDTSHDAYAPAEIASRIEAVGVKKAQLPALPLFTLAVLAGVFIALGAMFYTVTVTGSTLGFGPTKALGGVAFSLGLVLVVVGGAELFTGNMLIVMAVADGKVTVAAVLRNWAIVFAGNTVGAVGSAAVIIASGTLAAGDGSVAATAAAIAASKLALSADEAFVRGIACNVLVCLAIWLSFASRRVSGKVVCLVIPVAAFVALGFEHSIANLYLIPVGVIAAGESLSLAALAGNLVPVTLGNMVGGGVLVALTYWVIYIRSNGP